MPTGYVAPVANFIQTTLNGSITDSQGTITLNSTANLQAPGYVVIDRTDSAGTATPNAREVVSYTGISGSDLTGCTRGADNSTARSHSSGAIVETVPTVGMWNSLTTIVLSAVDSNGYLRAIASPASIAQLASSKMLISAMTITTSLNLSGVSVVGLSLSLPTVRRYITTTTALMSLASTNTFTDVSNLNAAFVGNELAIINAMLDVDQGASTTMVFKLLVDGTDRGQFTRSLAGGEGASGFFKPINLQIMTSMVSGNASIALQVTTNSSYISFLNGAPRLLMAVQPSV